MKGVFFLFKYLKKYLLLIIFFILFSFILSLFYIAIPLITGTFIDDILRQPEKESIMEVVFLLGIIAVLQIIISYLSSIMSAKLITSVSYDLEVDIFAHLQECSLKTVKKTDSSYTTQRIISDSNSIISLTVSLCSGLLSNLIIFISCCMFFFINAPIIVLVIFILFVIYFLIIKLLKQHIQKTKTEVKEKNAKYYKSAQEQISNLLFIKVYNINSYFRHKFELAYKELYKSKIKETEINYIYLSSSMIIKLIIQITLFIYCGSKIIDNKMTIGTFTILSSYLVILIDSIKYYINVSQQLVESNIAFDRINYYLMMPTEEQGDGFIPSINKICVNDLSFGYEKTKIIKNFSAIFEKGKIYQIMGDNGKGKTTLLALIMGLYLHDYDGEILYNSVDIKYLNMSKIREKCIGIVLQNGFILEESFDDNIFINKCKNVIELQSIVETFSLDEIKKRNMEKDSILRHEILSGGEIKKINIVRALLSKGTSILILDEPTVHLDAKSKQFLLKEIDKRKEEKITIIISHDEVFKKIIDYKIIL